MFMLADDIMWHTHTSHKVLSQVAIGSSDFPLFKQIWKLQLNIQIALTSYIGLTPSIASESWETESRPEASSHRYWIHQLDTRKTARVNFTYVWLTLLRKLNHKYESFCANIRPWQNNCLVPVTYGPESQVGRSEKYFILDKNFMSPVTNLPGEMTSAKFRSLTSFTHTHGV